MILSLTHIFIIAFLGIVFVKTKMNIAGFCDKGKIKLPKIGTNLEKKVEIICTKVAKYIAQFHPITFSGTIEG